MKQIGGESGDKRGTRCRKTVGGGPKKGKH